MSFLSFPPDSPRLRDITCYIFHQMENVFSVIILDFLHDNITRANRSGIRPIREKNENTEILDSYKVHPYMILFLMAADRADLEISARTIWMTSARPEVELSGTRILLDVDFRDLVTVRKWTLVGTARMHFLFRHNNKPFPNNNISILHNARNIFSAAQLKSHSRVFSSIFRPNHLLQGWIQLFLQAPINPTINHGPNKIVLIINLPTTRYG